MKARLNMNRLCGSGEKVGLLGNAESLPVGMKSQNYYTANCCAVVMALGSCLAFEAQQINNSGQNSPQKSPNSEEIATTPSYSIKNN